MIETESKIHHSRKNIFFVTFYLALFVISFRLFYWQIIKGQSLQEEGESQTLRKLENKGLRGQIFTSDNYLLVGNELVYDLKLDKQNFQGDSSYLAYKLSEIAIQDNWQSENLDELSHEDRETLRKNLEQEILQKFSSKSN